MSKKHLGFEKTKSLVVSINRIKKIAKSYFKNPVAGHDWFHVERVYKLAVKIGKSERADMSILKPAVLLHDIARKKEDRGEIDCHAKEGAKMAIKILLRLNYPKKKAKQIAYVIEAHRFRQKMRSKTLEAGVLQDADRLDALGAVSIGRIFSYGGEHKRPMYDPKIPSKSFYDSNAATSINHFFEKIFHLQPKTFNTQTARQIAKERYKFSKKFVKRFLQEWQGEL